MFLSCFSIPRCFVVVIVGERRIMLYLCGDLKKNTIFKEMKSGKPFSTGKNS